MIHIIVYTNKSIGIQNEDNFILINPNEELISEFSSKENLTKVFTDDCIPGECKYNNHTIKRSYIETHCIIEITTPSKQVHVVYQGKNHTLQTPLHITKTQALIIDGSQTSEELLSFVKGVNPLFTIPINCNQIEGIELCRLIMLHRLSTPKYFKYGQFLGLI